MNISSDAKFLKNTKHLTVCSQNNPQDLSRKVRDMILPVVNMDVTPLVQFLVFVSYIGLVYGLSVELIGSNPLRMMWRNSEAANPTEESEILEENTVSD